MLRDGRRFLISQTIFQGEGVAHPVWVVLVVEEVLLVLLGLDCFQPLTLWDYSPVIKVSLTEGTWLLHVALFKVQQRFFEK